MIFISDKMKITKKINQHAVFFHLLILLLIIISCSACSHNPSLTNEINPEIQKKQAKPLKPKLVVQLLHGKPIVAMSLSGNGEYLATASWDESIRLWHVKSGKLIQEFRKKNDNKWVTSLSLALSYNGEQLLSGGSDANIYLWSTITGEIISQYHGHTGRVKTIALSPDENHFVSGSIDKTIKYWPVRSNSDIYTQPENLLQLPGQIVDLKFTPDGQSIISASKNTAWLIDLKSRSKSKPKLKKFPEHPAGISVLAVSPDGEYLLSGDLDNNIRLSQIKTQKKIRTYSGHKEKITALAFSPDAIQFVSSSEDNSIRIWNINETEAVKNIQHQQDKYIGQLFYLDDKSFVYNKNEELLVYNIIKNDEVERFVRNSGWTSSIAFSNNGRYLLVGSWDQSAYLWDLRTGMVAHHLKGHKHHIRDVAFSENNKMAATAARDGQAIIWDVKTGQIIKQIQSSDKGIKSVAFSPDNKRILLGDDAGQLWLESVNKNTMPAEPVWQAQDDKRIETVAFTPDGLWVISSSHSLVSVRNSLNGQLKRTYPQHQLPIYDTDISPDGQLIASAGQDKKIFIQDSKSGKTIAQLDNSIGVIYSIAFSPDSEYLAVAGISDAIQIWNIATKKLISSFISDANTTIDLEYSPDGKYLLAAGTDQTTQIWKIDERRHVASVVGFKDGTWAVVDQQGRYDAANGGNISGLHWVIGRETIQLSQLKARYYEPALLSKVTGYNYEPVRNVGSFSDPKLYPEITTSWDNENKKIINIQLKDQGGGIGKVIILVNNKEVTSDARQFADVQSAELMHIRYDLTNHPFIIPGEENSVEVYAYNDEHYLFSRGVGQVFTPPAIKQDMTPTLWGIVAGISDYQGQRIDLRYAAKDADDFKKALTLGAKKLFGSDHVNIRLLTTTAGSNSIRPTKTAFIQAFEQLKEAKPWDVLVIYLAGHGLAIKDEYYYLTAEAGTIDLSDPEIVKHLMISGSELTHWLKSSPIQKQLMLLDTCAAGSLANSFSETREISSGQIRAIEQMKDRTGLHVLMGSAANAVSYEASQFEQGLMTYALLQGFKGAALKEGELVDVSRLLNYVADTVPELATEIGGIQRPRIASPGMAENFTIGFLDTNARAQVPLSTRKAILLKPVFINEKSLIDDLNLSEYLRRYFREQNYKKHKNKKFNPASLNIAYMDSDVFPSAISVRGLYQYIENKLHIRFALGSGKKYLSSKKITIPMDGHQVEFLEKISETLASEIYRTINIRNNNI